MSTFATTSRSSNNTSDEHDNNNRHTDDGDGVFDEFESEIARMSKDTDAILDSIIRATEQQPVAGKSAQRRRTLRHMVELQQQQQRLRPGDEEDTDIDDDMTDDGSVPEEVKQKIHEELSMLDSKDPHEVEEEIRRVRIEGSFSPFKNSTDSASVATDANVRSSSSKAFFGVEGNLLVWLAAGVWVLVGYVLLRVVQKGMLDSNGIIVLPLFS